MITKIRTNYTMAMGFDNTEALRVRVLRRCPDLPGWFHVIDQHGDRFVTHGSHLCEESGKRFAEMAANLEREIAEKQEA